MSDQPYCCNFFFLKIREGNQPLLGGNSFSFIKSLVTPRIWCDFMLLLGWVRDSFFPHMHISRIESTVLPRFLFLSYLTVQICWSVYLRNIGYILPQL